MKNIDNNNTTDLIKSLLRMSEQLDKRYTEQIYEIFTKTLAKIVFKADEFKPYTSNVLKARSIIKYIGVRYDMPANYYSTNIKKTEYVHARHVGMYIIKLNTKLNLSAIGDLYGGRDHATVLYGVKKIKEKIEVDPVFKIGLNSLLEDLGLIMPGENITA